MTGLRRELGVWGAASIVVGTVIGSGIFLVPRKMVLETGSAELVFAVWIFGGLLSLAGALTYAELAAMMPEAGGEYNYLKAAYGPFWGFLYGWTQMWVAKSGSIATLATGFFYYLANFRPELDATVFVIPLPLGAGGAPLEVSAGQLFAIAVILALGWLNWFGIRIGGGVQVAVTALKVLLIAWIILVGLGSASAGGGSAPLQEARGGVAGFFAALVAALWAYDGWNNLSMVASEVKAPQRNLPRALVFGTGAVMAIYLLTNAAYFRVLSPAEVASSDRVAAVMMQRALGGWGADLVSVAAMISIFAALNGSILSGSRVPYAMARDGYFFRRFSTVHERHAAPGFSILALSAWSCVLVLSGRYDQLVTLVIFPSWILYGMAAAAVMVLRRKMPDAPRPYRALGYPVIPFLFVAVAGFLTVQTLLNSVRESLLGLALILCGLPFYLFWNRQPRPSSSGGN
ncbi:MAG: amino acid permease [Bryobacteraceae bacterium]|nr:amino acid permease [Bryobacteraceae bacterium]